MDKSAGTYASLRSLRRQALTHLRVPEFSETQLPSDDSFCAEHGYPGAPVIIAPFRVHDRWYRIPDGKESYYRDLEEILVSTFNLIRSLETQNSEPWDYEPELLIGVSLQLGQAVARLSAKIVAQNRMYEGKLAKASRLHNEAILTLSGVVNNYPNIVGDTDQKKKAAELLSISLSTFYDRLKE